MDTITYLCCVCGTSLKRKQKCINATKNTNMPENLCENYHICQSCLKLAIKSFKEFNTTLDMKVVEETEEYLNGECSENGLNNCLICHTDLDSRKSMLVLKTDPSDLDRIMLNFIKDAISTETIGNEDRLCTKCWFKVKKIATEQINKSKSNGSEAIQIISDLGSDGKSEEISVKLEDHDETYNCKQEDSDDSNDLSISDFRDDPEDQDFICKTNIKIHKKCQSTRTLKKGQEISNCTQDDSGATDSSIDGFKDDTKDTNFIYQTNDEHKNYQIILPNYNRAPANRTKCIFLNCKKSNQKIIPNVLREKLLRDHKFYVPVRTKMCLDHLNSTNWDELVHSCTLSHNYFTSKQIEHMFSMIQTKKDHNLSSNILNFDGNFIQHCLGIEKEVLNTILMKEPKLKTTINGLLGLLMKHENGSSNDRISNLLNIPSSTLRTSMDNVRKILSKSPVTKEFGIQYLLQVKLSR